MACAQPPHHFPRFWLFASRPYFALLLEKKRAKTHILGTTSGKLGIAVPNDRQQLKVHPRPAATDGSTLPPDWKKLPSVSTCWLVRNASAANVLFEANVLTVRILLQFITYLRFPVDKSSYKNNIYDSHLDLHIRLPCGGVERK